MSTLTSPLAYLACLAWEPQLPPAAIPALLAAGDDPLVRRIVAGRSDLPTWARDQLLTDPVSTVRRAVAAALTDPAELTHLARTGGSAIQAGVAANRNTPVDVLDELLATRPRRTDPPSIASQTRAALMNPKTPTSSVLARLRETPVRGVVTRTSDQSRSFIASAIVRAHPDAAAVWVDCKDTAVLRAIAQQSRPPEPVVAQLVKRNAAWRTLGRNPFVPARLLAGQAATARAKFVKACAGRDPVELAMNPATHAEAAILRSATLDLLIAESSPTVETLKLLVGRKQPMVESLALAAALAGQSLEHAQVVAQQCAATRLAPIMETVPVLGLLRTPVGAGVVELAGTGVVLATLGDDPDAWSVFTRLMATTSAKVEDLLVLTLGTLGRTVA